MAIRALPTRCTGGLAPESCPEVAGRAGGIPLAACCEDDGRAFGGGSFAGLDWRLLCRTGGCRERLVLPRPVAFCPRRRRINLCSSSICRCNYNEVVALQLVLPVFPIPVFRPIRLCTLMTTRMSSWSSTSEPHTHSLLTHPHLTHAHPSPVSAQPAGPPAAAAPLGRCMTRGLSPRGCPEGSPRAHTAIPHARCIGSTHAGKHAEKRPHSDRQPAGTQCVFSGSAGMYQTETVCSCDRH